MGGSRGDQGGGQPGCGGRGPGGLWLRGPMVWRPVPARSVSTVPSVFILVLVEGSEGADAVMLTFCCPIIMCVTLPLRLPDFFGFGTEGTAGTALLDRLTMGSVVGRTGEEGRISSFIVTDTFELFWRVENLRLAFPDSCCMVLVVCVRSGPEPPPPGFPF